MIIRTESIKLKRCDHLRVLRSGLLGCCVRCEREVGLFIGMHGRNENSSSICATSTATYRHAVASNLRRSRRDSIAVDFRRGSSGSWRNQSLRASRLEILASGVIFLWKRGIY